jgi:hypothetical protein
MGGGKVLEGSECAQYPECRAEVDEQSAHAGRVGEGEP